MYSLSFLSFSASLRSDLRSIRMLLSKYLYLLSTFLASLWPFFSLLALICYFVGLRYSYMCCKSPFSLMYHYPCFVWFDFSYVLREPEARTMYVLCFCQIEERLMHLLFPTRLFKFSSAFFLSTQMSQISNNNRCFSRCILMIASTNCSVSCPPSISSLPLLYIFVLSFILWLLF